MTAYRQQIAPEIDRLYHDGANPETIERLNDILKEMESRINKQIEIIEYLNKSYVSVSKDLDKANGFA